MTSSAAPYGLLPAPVHVETPAEGAFFVLDDGARVSAHPALRAGARWWRAVTEAAFGLDLAFQVTKPSDAASSNSAQSTTSPSDDAHSTLPTAALPTAAVSFDLDETLPAAGYRLQIGATGVVVQAGGAEGAHSAAQTLRQLAGPRAFRVAGPPTHVALPHIAVADHPRYPWRGVLLDVARHFLPKRDVLRFIDLAAAHKLNVLQLHLTDDQGWRMEITRYPKLTEVGSWRAETGVGTWRSGITDGQPHGGFYTQDDLREIVAFARERGVTVVPEIDVPGHVEAAVAAYPELGTRKQPHTVRTTWGVSTEVLDPSEASLEFFRGVLDEVLDVFDSPWIGLGGDEVPTTLWLDSPEIVAQATALGLEHVRELHGWFIARLSEHVIAAGRRPVVWDEAFSPALPTEAIVTAWRGVTVGAVAMEAGHDVVMAPEQVVYLDHRSGEGPGEPTPVGFLRTIEDVLAFETVPAEVYRLHPDLDSAPGALVGAQAQVWTEHLESARRIDYLTFPRLAAFAEVVWSPPTDRAPGSPASTEFMARLAVHLPRLDAAGVDYRPLDGPRPWQSRPGAEGFPRDLAAEMAAAGWAGAGGWHEDNADEAGTAGADAGAHA
ncbi:hexosaminidase [Sanguibacter gelidistatuariae]|uniref:beta-N-acetylhexosaminidase n=1 Tax=Sanguibacter gelidistatuariae TaxID=1814289 RepID=A0A1G6QKU1_9MICO|nr:beta-N-acetylhexosaminidase [Sanguibacter gelidistatuariae]SDC92644.1 hexosaminidase [Sanguibacter gelidistatuariae]